VIPLAAARSIGRAVFMPTSRLRCPISRLFQFGRRKENRREFGRGATPPEWSCYPKDFILGVFVCANGDSESRANTFSKYLTVLGPFLLLSSQQPIHRFPELLADGKEHYCTGFLMRHSCVRRRSAGGVRPSLQGLHFLPRPFGCCFGAKDSAHRANAAHGTVVSRGPLPAVGHSVTPYAELRYAFLTRRQPCPREQGLEHG